MIVREWLYVSCQQSVRIHLVLSLLLQTEGAVRLTAWRTLRSAVVVPNHPHLHIHVHVPHLRADSTAVTEVVQDHGQPSKAAERVSTTLLSTPKNLGRAVTAHSEPSTASKHQHLHLHQHQQNAGTTTRRRRLGKAAETPSGAEAAVETNRPPPPEQRWIIAAPLAPAGTTDPIAESRPITTNRPAAADLDPSSPDTAGTPPDITEDHLHQSIDQKQGNTLGIAIVLQHDTADVDILHHRRIAEATGTETNATPIIGTKTTTALDIATPPPILRLETSDDRPLLLTLSRSWQPAGNVKQLAPRDAAARDHHSRSVLVGITATRTDIEQGSETRTAPTTRTTETTTNLRPDVIDDATRKTTVPCTAVAGTRDRRPQVDPTLIHDTHTRRHTPSRLLPAHLRTMLIHLMVEALTPLSLATAVIMG